MLTVTGRVRSVCFAVLCVWVHSAIIPCAVAAVLGAIYWYHMCSFVLFKSSQPVSRCFSVSLLPYASLNCKPRASTALVCELWVQSQLDTHCNPDRREDLHHHVMVIRYHAQVRTKSCTCKACRVLMCVHHFLCTCWACSRWVSGILVMAY